VQRLTAASYDRVGVEIGIAHIGVGAFHRAHQAAGDLQLVEFLPLCWQCEAIATLAALLP
jgi:hypothetical protein